MLMVVFELTYCIHLPNSVSFSEMFRFIWRLEQLSCFVTGNVGACKARGLTRFNTIAIQNYKFPVASGQGSHIGLSRVKQYVHLCITRPYQMSVRKVVCNPQLRS